MPTTGGPANSLQWVNDNFTGPGFHFHNNTIQSRRFGVLCMGRDGVISENTFQDNPGPSVMLLNDDDYDDPKEARMGFMPRNIAVTSNVFERCSRCIPDPFHAGSASTLLSVIGSSVIGPNRTQGRCPFQRVNFRGLNNITITNNNISSWYHGPAINLGDTAGAVVHHNTISGPPTSITAAVVISDAQAIRVDHNRFLGSWQSISAAVQVDINSTEGVTITDNTLVPPG